MSFLQYALQPVFLVDHGIILLSGRDMHVLCLLMIKGNESFFELAIHDAFAGKYVCGLTFLKRQNH